MSAPYFLAVDVRADATTAAVAVGSRSDAIQISTASPDHHTIPTAVFVAAEDLVFGERALARGIAEPDRLIGDFVSFVGVPNAVIVVDGEEFSPADLYAWTVDAVVTRVAQQRGRRAQGVWAVVPATWDDDRIDALAAALDRDGHPEVDFITASEALTVRYAQIEPFDTESTLLVCDVDDREFAAAVVRAGPTGHARPIGAPIAAPLWGDGEVDATLEERAVDSVAAALAQAGVDIDELDAIILGGVSESLGSIERLLVDRFGDPIGTDPQPALATVLGAAYALAQEEIALAPRQPAPAASLVAAGVTGAPHAVASTGRPSQAPAWYRRPVGILGAAVAALVLAGGAFASAFVLEAVASEGVVAVVPSPSPSIETSSDASPRPTLTPSASATPLPAPTPDAAPPAPLPPEADSPRAPANPRVPNTTAPRVPSAPIAVPVPPAAPNPPAAPLPAVPDPTETQPPVPDPTETPPVPDPTETPLVPDPAETQPAVPGPGDGESPTTP